MLNHRYLFPLEPNLIIQLLHVCINHNYFGFSAFTFQQIHGTAMGASFSPTLANIFLSVIIRQFLQTQPVHPLLIKRYIDDLLILWKHSEASLKTFLLQLNEFHPSLHFKYTFSSSEVNFLDLTIYKDDSSQSLHTRTYQKPQNLYQYLHFTSNHPKQLFKAIIVGELIRYVRTNSTERDYLTIASLFKERLSQRGYPVPLINKTVKTVSHSDRQHLLESCKKTSPKIQIPIFKAPVPPNFEALKKVILQGYNALKLPNPRFITLKHKTIGNDLIRAELIPDEKQTVSINVSFPQVHTHTTAGTLPRIKPSTVIIKKCKNPRCCTCSYHFECRKFFSLTVTGKTYHIRHSFSCSSRYVIYLITCSKCSKQYVGLTSQKLQTRMNHHRSEIFNKVKKYMNNHFNFADHSIRSLKVQAIDQANTLQELIELEHYWIATLKTRVPFGLNILP